MKKSSLADADLCRAVAEMERGSVDAQLGGSVIKKRVAPVGRGKSGASRVIVATNYKNRWYFLYGFDKNERANINKTELHVLQEIAKDLLKLNDAGISAALLSKNIVEICHDDQDNSTS